MAPCSLLEYDTKTQEVKVLLDQLRFPNGVQLSPAEDFVLVAETTMARIRRYVRYPLSCRDGQSSLWPGLAWDGLGDINLRDLRCGRLPSLLCDKESSKIRNAFSFSPISPCLKSRSFGESQFNAGCMHPGSLYPLGGPSPCNCI